MKKLLLFVISLFIICGCTQTNSEIINIQGIQPIEYKELTKSLNSNAKFILYIGRDDCQDCKEFYPLLEQYINTHKDTGIYYLDVKEYRDASRKEDATKEEIEFFKNIYKELNFDWTPTIHVIDQGKFIKTYQYLDESYYDLSKEDQIIKKEEYIKQFEVFMNEYFMEVYNEQMS